VAVAFFGDGASTQGVMSEALNLSALWKLPMIFVCENNLFSEFSRSDTVVAGRIMDRALAYGVPAVQIDGNDIDFIRNMVAVAYPNGTVTAKDATSVTAYGPQSDSVDGSTLPDTAGYIARQLAAYRLRARKDPATRVPAVTVDMRGGDGLTANGPTMIALDIGDRVQVKRRPNGATDPYNVACSTQGIAHNITPERWEVDLSLSPAPKSATEGSTSGSMQRGISNSASNSSSHSAFCSPRAVAGVSGARSGAAGFFCLFSFFCFFLLTTANGASGPSGATSSGAARSAPARSALSGAYALP
jgi:hypothetical protein